MSLTKEQAEQINRVYEYRRLDAAMLKSERQQYINAHVDGYKELTDAIVSISMERTKKALAGDHNALSDLSSLIDDLSSQKQSLLIGAGYPSDYLENTYKCPDCKDTGYINGERCHCYKQEILSFLYNQSNIRDVLQSVDFSMIKPDYYHGEDLIHFQDSLENAKNFVRNFDKDYQNLIFYGTVGTGKSLISSCIAKELINSGHSVLYYSAASLMDAISRETFDYKARTGEAVSDLYDCDLLIIDDLGTEMNNNFTISSLFSLLNERAIRKKSIVISTNLPYEDLRDRYTDRIFSRVTGGYTFCRMSGPDIRIAQRLN